MQAEKQISAQVADWTANDGGLTRAAVDAIRMGRRIDRLSAKLRRKGAAGISARIALIDIARSDDPAVVRDAAECALSTMGV